MNALIARHSKLKMTLSLNFLGCLATQPNNAVGKDLSDLLVAFVLAHQGGLKHVVGDFGHRWTVVVDRPRIFDFGVPSCPWQYLQRLPLFW